MRQVLALTFFATSPASYNDNQWHYAVVTYGGSTVILYIDGVQVASKSTSGASPDSSGTQPVRVAANSRVTPPTTNFFIGDIDEVHGPGMMTLQQQNRQMHLPARPLTQENRSSTLTFLAAEAEVDITMHQVLPPQVLTTLMWQALLLCSSHHLVLQHGLRHQQTLQAEAFIVNKGGIGSDSAGQNMNYQISMTSTEVIKVGFETSTGADFFVSSPITYNDNQWHYAVVTYDGSSNLILIHRRCAGCLKINWRRFT